MAGEPGDFLRDRVLHHGERGVSLIIAVGTNRTAGYIHAQRTGLWWTWIINRSTFDFLFLFFIYRWAQEKEFARRQLDTYA